jgi:alkylation response protein AidB-like acyl-CoA dehydrogenase
VVFANGFQLFGAMGFTWENELHLYLKRAVAGDLLLGGTSHHRQAILALGSPGPRGVRVAGSEVAA